MIPAPATFQFRDTWYPLAPPWLRTGTAELYLGTLELARDLLMEKAYQAITFRLPGQGDPSQLPYLAYDRQLVQGLAETNAAFVVRLRNAFTTWKTAGSRPSICEAVQAYLQGLQPGVASSAPLFALVSGCWPNVTTWATVAVGDVVGAAPRLTTLQGAAANWNWDGASKPWRAWFVLYQSLVEVASGTGADTTTAAAGSLRTNVGDAFGGASYGQNVNGVWVPNTTGTAVNNPWITITGLTGANPVVGQWLTLSGMTYAGNNGTFPITAVNSSSSVVVANPAGVANDSGAGAWVLSEYPFLAPAAVWGAPNAVFGEGETVVPPTSGGAGYGQLQQGAWVPTFYAASFPTAAWGLAPMATTVLASPPPTANVIASLRALVKQWKSASTWYHDLIVSFGAAEFTPSVAAGSGNPSGTFEGHGQNVNGVWTPNRLETSPYDAWCQGTGAWSACSAPNIT